mgnify:FL=1|tara:strand:+ start:14460 stop:14648 length:189 start_codon:yes stop_codon:yes gene_type:complete
MPYHTTKKMKATKGNLTARQKEMLKKHSAHHTKKHISEMKKDMKKGKSFTEAHKLAMKKVGK